MRHWIARVRVGNAIGEREHVIRDRADAVLHRAAGWQVEGPFVPEPPQGAVAMRHAESAMARRMMSDDTLDAPYDEDMADALRLVRAALGGQ
jgi:hypothetical protein